MAQKIKATVRVCDQDGEQGRVDGWGASRVSFTLTLSSVRLIRFSARLIRPHWNSDGAVNRAVE